MFQRRVRNRIHTHKGTAIITALFIMTLVAIVATAMSLRLQIDIYRTRLTLNNDQSYLAAQAVEYWAIGQLKKAAATSDPKQTDNIDQLPKRFPAALFSYPGAIITGQLEDLQGKFNLNNLTEITDIPRFAKLLIAADNKIEPSQATAIAEALAEWLVPYQPSLPPSSTEQFYQNQNPSYLIAHSSMVSISEFRLIKGVSDEIYQAVAPYICALPKPTPININSAPLAVLQTLGTGITKEQAELIIKDRSKTGYNFIADLNKNPKLKELEIPEEQITVLSNYFLTTAIVKIAEQQLVVYNTLDREKTDDKYTVNVIAQSINAL